MNFKLASSFVFVTSLFAGCCSRPPHDATAMIPHGARPLFNGRDLAGWKAPTPNPFWTWTAENTLVGENDAGLRGHELYTDKLYKNVEMEIEFRYTGEVDTGVFLRKPLVQVQIGISRSLHIDKTGSLYQEGPGGSYVGNATGTDKLLREGQWNKLRFIAKDDNLKVWLNDVQVLETSIAKYPEAAPLGLQIHAGLKMKVEFRNAWVKEI